jgi:hypothetical protein
MQCDFLDFRAGGFVSITCQCGEEFFDTAESILHVEEFHMDAEEFDSPALARDVISRMLSPNPIPPEAHSAQK